jgi:hypothetical protein
MRTTALRIGSILLATTLAFGACGSDLSTDTQSQFTDFEANQLLNAASAVIDDVDAARSGFSAAIEPVNRTVGCSLAGSATVVGTLDPGSAVDFDARITYSSCANFSVTLNGVLDVTATSSIPTPGVLRVTWTYLGTVRSRKDGQVRTCSMDVTQIRTTANGATTITARGNLCNRTL